MLPPGLASAPDLKMEETEQELLDPIVAEAANHLKRMIHEQGMQSRAAMEILLKQLSYDKGVMLINFLQTHGF